MKKQFTLLFICFLSGMGVLSATEDPTWKAYQDSAYASYFEGNFQGSIHYLNRGKARLESILEYVESDSTYNLTLNDLGVFYFEVGNYHQAIQHIKTAFEHIVEFYGSRHPDYGNYLSNLAVQYETIGQFSEALELQRDALVNTRANLGVEHSDYGFRLNNVASAHIKMGQYAEALPLLVESLDNAAGTLGVKHPEYANRLSNLATLYLQMGRYEEALPLYEESLRFTAESQGEDHMNYAHILFDLAFLHNRVGRYDAAVPIYMNALELTAKLLGKQHTKYGAGLADLAAVYKNKGRYEEALSLIGEALEITEASVGKDHEIYGSQLRILSKIYRQMEQYDQAIEIRQSALANAQLNLGEDHDKYGNDLNYLAELYRMDGQYDEALPLMLRANQNMKLQIDQIFGVSNEKNKQDFLSTLKMNYDNYQSFAYQTGYRYDTLNPMLYDNILLLKGLVLNSTASLLAEVRQSQDEELNQLLQHWMNAREQMAYQYQQPKQYRQLDLDSLETLARSYESTLVQRSSAFAQIRNDVDWRQVQKALQDNEAGIEFVHFNHTADDGSNRSIYAAMLLRPNMASPQIIPLFEDTQLSELLTEHESSASGININSFYRGVKPLGDHDVASSSHLYQLVWAPLEKALSGVKKIFYVPSGRLHQISFAALSIPGSGYLCEDYNLVQLNSTRSIATGSAKPENHTAILIGGIEYDRTSEAVVADLHTSGTAFSPLQRSGLHTSFTYLSGTLREAESIHALFRSRGSESALVSGTGASEEYFKSLSGNSPKVLHIATHGFFVPDLGDENTNSTGDAVFNYIDDPMFRSGIILAGANHVRESNQPLEYREDGVLTAYEISNLDLTNTDLVVLSACETGLGEIRGSEGVFGLQRSFKIAGADFLIMSLWQVPDEETAEFMTQFYQLWLGGQPIREAFQATQRKLSKNYPPQKWAAFVLVE